MNVEIVDYTKKALDMLVYTKNTRLQGERTFKEVKKMSTEEKLDIYEGMLDTIQSPFEFVHFTFLLQGVSRSFTHQLVRTRNASYAQESLRAVDATSAEVYNPSGSVDFQQAAEGSIGTYGDLVHKDGISIQDARELLPMGVYTNILMKVDLRELGRMAEVRLCKRTAGEYQEVFKEMKAEVLKIYPWLDSYIEVYCVKHGTCCFPRYKDCPVQSQTIKISKQRKQIIKEIWIEEEHVADPGIYK